MRRLLATKLKTLKIIGQISGPLKDVLAEADSGQAVEMTTNSLSINLNKVTGNAGTLVYVKVLLLSPELREEHNRIKTLHKFGIPEEDSPIVGSVKFEIKENKVEEVMAKVEKYIAEHAGPVKDLLSVVAEGHRLCVGISLPKFQGKTVLEPHKDIVDKVQEELKVDQNLEITLRLAASPKQLLEEGAEPVVNQILNGISFDVKLNLWKKIADVVMKIVDSGDLDQSLTPILGGIAPVFLLRVNGNLDLEVDETMKAKIAENSLV
jgi:stress-induced morphogen